MDPNTQSEHRGANILAIVCFAIALGGQIGCLAGGWNFFGSTPFIIFSIVSFIGMIYFTVRAHQKVWSNDDSPNGLFALSFLAAAACGLMPVIWHATNMYKV
jgi:cation transport ATPase